MRIAAIGRMLPMRASMAILVLGVALLLLGGCGSGNPGPTAQATATTPATATATLLPVPFQVPPNCSPVAPGAFPTGVYVDSSDNTNIATILPNGQHIHDVNVVSCYTVAQQHYLTFDVAHCNDTAAAYGDYTWTVDGGVLRFVLVQDHCFKRAVDLLGGGKYWTKQASR